MRVLVTGANGHLGFNLCRALAARPDLRVRASIRSLDDRTKSVPVRAIAGVELVALDVRHSAQFDAALAGIDTLFHVAATYSIYTGGAGQDREMIRDSVEGVEVALHAAARARVRKVVLTSSIVTLPMVAPGAPATTEAEWLSDLRLPYARAKTEAERTAWRLAGELRIPLVSVLPGGIGGPGFLRRTPTTDIFESIMLGGMRFGAPRAAFTYVDVRDVVKAHVLAAENDVSGRFAVSSGECTLLEFTRMMHGIDPAVPAAPFVLPRFAHRFLPLFDAVNARLLGTPRLITPEAVAMSADREHRIDTTRARSELGWSPTIPIQQSIGELMATIRALRRAEGKRRMA